MNYWYITTVNLFLLAIVAGLFFLIGKLIYRGNSRKEYSFLRVITHFIAFLLGAGLITIVLIVIPTILLGLIEFFHEVIATWNVSEDVSLTEVTRFKGGNFLLMLLILILCVAIVQYLLRKKITRRFPRFALQDDDYDILEYLIQWMTIFLAVYQFMFDGLRDAFTFLEDSRTAREFFSIALSPQNINLVVQPLLISSWITIAMEKLHARNTASHLSSTQEEGEHAEPEQEDVILDATVQD